MFYSILNDIGLGICLYSVAAHQVDIFIEITTITPDASLNQSLLAQIKRLELFVLCATMHHFVPLYTELYLLPYLRRNI